MPGAIHGLLVVVALLRGIPAVGVVARQPDHHIRAAP